MESSFFLEEEEEKDQRPHRYHLQSCTGFWVGVLCALCLAYLHCCSSSLPTSRLLFLLFFGLWITMRGIGRSFGFFPLRPAKLFSEVLWKLNQCIIHILTAEHKVRSGLGRHVPEECSRYTLVVYIGYVCILHTSTKAGALSGQQQCGWWSHLTPHVLSCGPYTSQPPTLPLLSFASGQKH